ncbi:amino acid adenylation domain-containing protein [Streptomyces sp. NPDC046862]|uniref:amino acid adenylation domain-containing protein n=1 Tax=Streptomyces sp. NPDC046862 TaxID=3154603 RepID=UPI0034566394
MRTMQSADTWIGVLGAMAARRPDAVVFTFLADDGEDEATLTFAELDRGARTVAAYLQAEGLAGQRVMLWYPSGLDYLVAFFGCLYAGAIAVPAYPPTRQRRSVERVLAIIEDAEPACVLTTSFIRDRLPADTTVGGREPIATDLIGPEPAARWKHPGAGPDTIAFLQYTSGSTGRPRGVVLTHGNLLANSAMIQEMFGTSERTRAVSWLPMYHDMGLIGSILQVVYCGGTSTLMSPMAFVRDPVQWLRAISRTRATASGGPNFAYDLCVDRITPEERAGLDLSNWELAFNGAEPIRAQTLERFTATFAECGLRASAMTPCYGLAEATLLASARRVGSGMLRDPQGRVSSGVTPAGVRMEVVHPETRELCGPGRTGELWVAGAGVGQGYWNQPEVSESVFRARLADGDGTPFLRTGDLGYRHDGELYVAGRRKDLVIVRGRNHYPQDVERTAETADERVRQGGCAAFAVTLEENEELVVVAEVGPREQKSDLAGLAHRIRTAVLADHEVRPHTVAVIKPGELRKTSSGKVQRHACRAAYLSGELEILAVADDTTVPAAPRPREPKPLPSGAVARILLAADLVREELAALARLRPEQIDLDEPLVALGLDSMAAIQLQHRLATRFGVDTPADDALAMTGSELVETIAVAVSRSPHAPVGPSVPTPPVPTPPFDLPCPPGQASFWLEHHLVPGSPAHLLAMALRITGPVDASALRRAIEQLSDRHEALRTTFPFGDGTPVGHVHARLAPRFEEFDAAGWTAAELDERIAAFAHEPFDLEDGPLLRAGLFLLAPDEHRLVIAVDHLVTDLWSMEVLLRELDVLYPAALRRTEPDLPQPAPYSAYADTLAAPAEESLSHWCERLDGAPTLLALPTAKGTPGTRRMETGEVPFAVGRRLSARIVELAQRLRTTPYSVVMAAYQTLLGQWSGQEDLLVGSPAHGRGRAAHRDTVGLLVNIVPLRADVTPGRSVADLITGAHDAARDALAHSEVPFSALVDRLQPVRHRARSPLVQAVLAWQRPIGEHGAVLSALALNRAGSAGTIGGLRVETLSLPSGGAQFDLVLTVAEIDGALAGRLQYDLGLFDAEPVSRAAAHLTALLEAFVDEPEQTLGDLPQLRPQPSARELVLDGGPVRGPLRCVHERFEAHAAARPDATALVCDGLRLSYRELDARARELAAELRAAGAGPADLVAIQLRRSIDLVVAVIAVMKSGAAYVPLEPAHPQERRSLVLDSARPRYLIDEHGLTVLDRSEREPHAPFPHADLDRLAYVLFTSGSSGRPKGVPVGHRALANLFAATAGFGFGPDDVWTQFHSFAFDYSVWELWGCLVHGGTLVIVPAGSTMSADAFWDLVRRERVTVLGHTPAVFREMTLAAPDRLTGLTLRHLVFGGEKLMPGHLSTWRAHGDPSVPMATLYGLTETAVVATVGPVGPGDDDIAIGPPLAGARIVLLDEDGRPAAEGEICVSGVLLADGYLNEPELTAARFTSHPVLPGERLFRTGDLGRLRPDGALEYLGRIDDQVQVRGYRVEPGEIVAALTTHPGVRDAVVLPEPGPDGTQRLVAFVVPGQRDGWSPGELRGHLRTRVPEYMVPSAFIEIDAIPVTTNGKVDRRALPSSAPRAGDAAPATDTEREVARLVAEMVALPAVGRDDDLFALGWHSLLMTRLASRIKETYAVTVPLHELFTDPTVERISRLIEQARGEGAVVRTAGPITRADRSRYEVAAGAERLPEPMRRRDDAETTP